MNGRLIAFFLILLILFFISACVPATPIIIELPTATITPTASPTETAWVPSLRPLPTTGNAGTSHSMRPVDVIPPADHLVYDVESIPRKRAPYGDSYDINRLERPFLQNMKYVPDLDIVTFALSEDADWYYVSIQLAGNNPNNKLGIDYGIELDLNADGFGDHLIWAYPPYSTEWTTNWVQVYSDTNHDTAGQSSGKSDAGINGDGYETLIFDGASAFGQDQDLAWMRMQEGTPATMQFAFKKSLSGPVFLMGIIADGGLKDVTKLDYNDRFRQSEAGSPIRGNLYYPLKQLFAVDNTCWEAYGMKNPVTVAKVCPPDASEPATAKPPVVEDSTASIPTPNSSPPSYP